MKIKFYLFLMASIGIAHLANSQAYNPKMKVDTCHLTESNFKLDGILNEPEWRIEQPIVNRIDVQSGDCNDVTVGPESDNTITFGTMWDNDNFYIGVKCLDKNLIPGNHSVSPMLGDQLELFFSLSGKKLQKCYTNTWPQNYFANDFQAIADYGKTTFYSPQAIYDADPTFKVAYNIIPGGVTIEVMMSWYDMDSDITPSQGVHFNFDIGWSDSDQAGAPRNSQLMWNAGSPESFTGSGMSRTSNLNWTQTDQFGLVVLGDIPTSVAAVNQIKNLVSSVSLVPNPSNGSNSVALNIDSKEAQNLNISVMNSLSQTLFTTSQNIAAGSNTVDLNTSSLNNGIYFVSISNGNSSMAKKLVVNK